MSNIEAPYSRLWEISKCKEFYFLLYSLAMHFQQFYAHSLEGQPVQKWHLLEEHLNSVADLAKSFADEFGSGEWAYLAGLWQGLKKL